MTLDQLAYGAYLLGPEIVLILFGFLVLLIDLFLIPPTASRRWLAYLALAGVVISALSATLIGAGGGGTAFGGYLSVDGFALFFKYLFLLATGLVILAAGPFFIRYREHEAEFYGLLLLTTVGLNLMAATSELISIYLALEISSLSLAFLAAWAHGDRKSGEAGLKFFVLSA